MVTFSIKPAITSANKASGAVGVPFTFQVTAANGATSYAASGLPAGLAINPSTGLISGTGVITPRQQITDVTSYIDGSQVYGSDSATALSLRTMVGGQMKTSAGNLLPELGCP